MTRVLLLILISAIACRSEPPARFNSATREASAPSEMVPTASAPDWLNYDAGSFTIQYPPSATLKKARSHPSDIPGAGIVGPQIHLPVAPDLGPSDGPAYQLIVSSFPNLRKLTTQQWVDSIRRRANGGPMDADSLSFLAAPDTVSIGALQFLRLEPFCGDCAPEELYLAHGDRTAVLSYVFDIRFPGDRERQRKAYLAMLKTFRWKR